MGKTGSSNASQSNQVQMAARYLPAVLAFLYFGYLASLPVLTTRWLDFPVYWEAGKKALHGQTVYDVVGHFQYKYSPVVALLFGKLFETVSFETASFVFQKTMLFFWISLFLRFARRDFRIVVVAILFFGSALRLDLELGQINALVLYLLALLFGALSRPSKWSEDVPFGFVFSFAVQLKLFALILLLHLVLRREWRKLSLGLIFLPVLSIGGIAVERGWSYAIGENLAWVRSLTESTDELLLSEQNVALLGRFGNLFGLPFGKFAWILAGLGFAVYLWRNRTKSVEWFRDWLLYAVAVFNPLVWSYWILYAMPLFSARFSDFKRAFHRGSPTTRFFGAIGSIFVFFAFNGQHARWAWSGGILFALVILGLGTIMESKEPG